MEDEIIETGEDESLNSEDISQDNWEEEKTTFTREEVEAMRKEMMSNSEKGVQKIISEKKAYERALEESGNIADDPTRLVELYESDPKTAKIILDKFFNWKSIEEYKEDIDYKEDYADPVIVQKKIQREAEKIAFNKEFEAEKKKFISKLEMSDEEKENFEEALEELKGLKSFKDKELVKVFEKAYKIWNDNEETLMKLKNKEVIAKTIATDESKSNWSSKAKEKNEFAEFFAKTKKR